jgi:thiol-disulfide isomerase/thioredoxin
MNNIRETLELLLLRQGKKVKLDTKPILIHFWDQECPKCVEDCIPEIVNTINSAKYNNIFFIGVCVNENGFTEEHLKEYNLTWPQVSVRWDSFFMSTLGIDSLPTILIVDQKDTITYSDSILNVEYVLNAISKTN